jgi:flagellar protein FliS
MNAYLSEYQNTQVSTASPEQILILLYEGAIRFSNQAMQAIKERNRPRKAEKITKVVHIISELSGTLDLEIGGEIAENLEKIYNFMILELLAANVHDDQTRISAVVKMLSELKDSWQEAIKIKSTGNTEIPVAAGELSPHPPADYKPLKAKSY